ncbi:hypothetical protein EON65_11590 [archaeon]|nr:MAG: hypothetical protein EON65_11590 [archaeon]
MQSVSPLFQQISPPLQPKTPSASLPVQPVSPQTQRASLPNVSITHLALSVLLPRTRVETLSYHLTHQGRCEDLLSITEFHKRSDMRTDLKRIPFIELQLRLFESIKK